MIIKKVFKGAIILLYILFLVACGKQHSAPIYNGWHQSGAKTSHHRVSAGETLYSIAWSYGYDYRDIARINQIKSPYYITIGQDLYLPPESEIKKVVINKEISNKPHVDGTKPKVVMSNNLRTRKQSTEQGSDFWQWPVKGKVIKAFNHNGAATDRNKGIDIAGEYGQKVHASRSGQVVYSGDGLPGYGNLVIIKHDANYLSAYAHNKRNLVQEGARVKVGQVIAEMGSTGTNRVVLHFEIRQAGKPVDPRNYLPS